MSDLGAASDTDPSPFIPPQVAELAPREREVATIVYRSGAITAKALEERLSDRLSNAAVRSMLSRLCSKGILSRRKLVRSRCDNDHRVPYVYVPAISLESLQHKVLRQIAEDHFRGSLLLVARTAIEILYEDIAMRMESHIRRAGGETNVFLLRPKGL